MQALEEKLQYHFKNPALLEEALRHSSYANEHRGANFFSNERLEFLGDSVLGFVTAEYLFARHPDLPEGDLTRIRAALVCDQSLHEVAQKLNLGSYLKLGKGRWDYKTLLQEHIQRKAGQELTYCMVREEGPDHAKTFVTEVRLNGAAIGEGSGHSKKESEQMAAKSALEKLDNQ